MEKGTNYTTNYLLECIGKEKLEIIESYINKLSREDYVTFSSRKDLEENFKEYLNSFIRKLSQEEMDKIIRYTGIDFRRVNPILRGYWDYDKSGVLTDEIKNEAHALADDIRKILFKSTSLGFNFKTYRGTSIRNFYSYGINSLSDLTLLIGRYFYEEGFTSTSLLQETSFFSKQPEWGDFCNIEIEYLISADSDDGMALINDSLSYSESQNEFLINSGSLFKVLNVEIDSNNNQAKVIMVLIPEKIWNPLDYEIEHQNLQK